MKRPPARPAVAAPARQRPLVTTKLRPPSNHGALIERPQLIESIRQTLERSLALVHAPAGFGKTTLASQWFAELKASGQSVAWLSLDEGDNDIDRFLGYLVEAVRSAQPEMGNGLNEVIEANPGTATDFIIDSLVNELSLEDHEFVLFLDDWHLVSEPAVHDVLSRLLARRPPNLHLVLTSRTRAGVPLARLRVADALVEIDASRLRFDYEESRHYLTDAKSLQLAQSDLEALWKSTEGWAAALQLASLSLRDAVDHERILHWTSGSANDIGEYLAENVMDRLPADQERFLLRTSILERLCSELCAAVTGEPDSARRLETLERQEMFLLPLDEERQWFRYHHLFARFLQRRLHKQFAAADVEQLHRAAAHWLGAHGHTAEAVEHALKANDVATALDLVERDAMPLVEHSFMSTLLALVRKLPRTALFERAPLQLAIAWSNCLTHHPDETVEALWHVERIAASSPPEDAERLRGEANVARACLRVYADQVDGADALLGPCIESPDKYSPWAVGVAANVRTFCLMRAGEFDKVGPLQRWARDYQTRTQGPFSLVYGRCFEGMAAMRAGDTRAAKKAFTEAVDHSVRSAGPQSISNRLASAALGQLLYEENDLEPAERLLRDSRGLGVEGGVVDFYLATYLAGCRVALQKGDVEEALAILDEAEETARVLSLRRLLVAVAGERVRVRLATGDVAGAEDSLAELDAGGEDSLPLQDGDDSSVALCVARARLLFARGRAGAAIERLQREARAAPARAGKPAECLLRVMLALAFEHDGRALEAEQTLLAVLEDAVPRGMTRTFLDEGAPLVAILDRVRDKARKRSGASPDALTFGSSAQRILAQSRHPLHGVPRLAGSSARVAELTPRESEVMTLLELGRSNKEIARALSVSVDTVKYYLKSIFVKLGVSSRTQAISEARRLAPPSPEG